MSVPEFVLTEDYTRRRNRWALRLQELPEEQKNKDLLKALEHHEHAYRRSPTSSNADSVNAVLALLQMRGLELPRDWIDPSKVPQGPASSGLLAACKAQAAYEQRKEAMTHG